MANPPNPPAEPPAKTEPPWMVIARSYLGERELKNGKPNPLISEFFQSTGFKGGDATDAWCSAFINHCMAKAGVAGTGKANARSWLQWGRKVKLPTVGCVVVFSRPPEPAAGHVGLFVSEEKTWIHVLGGNQNNMVCVRPYARARWLDYRMP